MPASAFWIAVTVELPMSGPPPAPAAAELLKPTSEFVPVGETRPAYVL